MISFIIIGRNEGWKLSKCLNSVYANAQFNKLSKYEVIYCDSDSNDDSIDRAKQFEKINIYKITENYNAAIARNVGSKESSGDILFFLDGDVELKLFDIRLITNDEVRLKYGYISGYLNNVNYTQNWEIINQTHRGQSNKIKDRIVTIVGGAILVIEKKTWLKFGGMDQRLKTNEDRDFCLRLAKKKIFGIRKKEIFGLHHTIPYKDFIRMWQFINNGSYKYKAINIRKHFFSKYFLPVFLREEWTLILLLFSFLLAIINPLFITIYILAVFFRNKKYFDNLKHFFIYVLHRIIQDITVFLSIPFFYPKKVNYKVITIK
jgi:glycosyltransferase involved in cell wall biosynthesis